MTSPEGTTSSSNREGSPDEASSTSEHAEQWAALTELLDASGPEEVVSHVRALQQSMHALDAQLEEASDDEVGAAIHEMREQLDRLREQNADLARRPDADLERAPGRELHPETEVLLDQLEAASLSEAQERIRSLTTQVETLYREKEVLAEAGLMSSREALDEIDRLQRECDRLRSQEPQESAANDETAPSSPDPTIADILGIDSPQEARELNQAVRRLSSRLDTLLDEKETLANRLGVADADAILDLVRSMEGQLSALYENRDEAPLNGHAIPSELESILGISTVEEARELVSYVHAMDERLEQLSDEHETLASEGLDAQEAVALIDSMEAQLVDLYGTAEAAQTSSPPADAPANEAPAAVGEPPAPASSDASITEILGIAGAAEARELDRLVRGMSRELDRLRSETERLSAAGLTAESALQMIDNMEAQLVALYHAQDRSLQRPSIDGDSLDALAQVLGVDDPAASGAAPPASEALVQQTRALLDEGRTVLADGDTASSIRALLDELAATVEELRSERNEDAEQADAIQEVLGISTVDEARDLTSLVQNLDAQLQTLYAEQEALNEVGLSSVGDAIDMIQSMEHQLEELYQEQEALQNSPRPASPTRQDTFEQLQSLYKEQEQLRRALGVSSANDVIEMVEDLTAQLDATYAEHDRATDDPPSPQADAGTADAAEITLDSMRHQLEALYAEREALLQRGFASAEEAAARLDELQDQLQSLQEEHAAFQAHLNRLEEAVGTTDVSEIARRMAASQAPDWESDASLSSASPPPPETANDDPFVDRGPALLPEDTRDQLGTGPAGTLNDLSVGVLQLDDRGTIQALNDKGRQFPGLDAPDEQTKIVGSRLFERVPSTSNALFLGRFKNGVEQGAMDARFPYTFVTPGDRPTVFFVHLYRDEAHQTNWVLFRPA